MLKLYGRRLVRVRRRTLTLAAMALVAPLCAMVSASPAMAEPQGIFKVFNECPTENPAVTLCNYTTTSSGRFTIGENTVPINQNIILQNGFVPVGESEIEFTGVEAKNHETLSKTELEVPGGLVDLVKCNEITGSGAVEIAARALCKTIFDNGLTGVTATTELAASESNPLVLNEADLATESGTAVALPIRVHLKNPLLGNNCYIGSVASPIKLKLTTGTSGSLHGARGTAETLREKGLLSLRLKENSLVDNTFTVPGVEGCGELLLVKGFLDSIIDGKLKIPNSSGENAAVLNGELRVAAANEVVESESF